MGEHIILQNIESKIKAFQSGSLKQNTLDFFSALGYESPRQMELFENKPDRFLEFLSNNDFTLNEEQSKVEEWKSVDLVMQLTNEEINFDFEEWSKQDSTNFKSYLILAIELAGQNYTNSTLSSITRTINKLFPNPVFVLYKYDSYLTFSLIERRPHKRNSNKDVLEKVSQIHNININKPHTGHIHILNSFSLDSITKESNKNKLSNFRELHNGWSKVLNTEVLNDKFYKEYQKLLNGLVNEVYSKYHKERGTLIPSTIHQGVLNLMNRIMFIYFLQKKNWLAGDENFIYHFWKKYQTSRLRQNTFHSDWLNTLFFNAFNNKFCGNKDESITIAVLAENFDVTSFPYLNGGLFTKHDEYDFFTLEDIWFTKLFEFFESYIFTISEETPLEINLEINPELLGRMYEGMVSRTDIKEEEGEHGIVYTEKAEINFMVRRSFVEVISQKSNNKYSREFIYKFVFDPIDEKLKLLKEYKTKGEELIELIMSVTSCDPACGSGSMLLGVLQLQMELIRAVRKYLNLELTPKEDYHIKKQLISDCIYGVDIKEWAVRIAELRLWLYMISEAEFDDTDELQREPLLPNLDFKLRTGNSLLPKFGNIDFDFHSLLSGRKKNEGSGKKLWDFIKKKKSFIKNESTGESEDESTYEKLKEEEMTVFKEVIQEQLIVLTKKITSPNVVSNIWNEAEETVSTEVESLKTEIEKLEILDSKIRNENRLPFSYDFDFMEIFQIQDDPGFDLVIGNPPYIRQEDILPPEDPEYIKYLLQDDKKDEKTEVNKKLKEELNNKVYENYPFLKTKISTIVDGKKKQIPIYGNKVPGRSDIYVYFQLLCPRLLNSKGTLCFIISNSWLDVEFGSFVQNFLLKHSNLYAVYDCNVRSFDAAVNTIIYLHSALKNADKRISESAIKQHKPSDNIVRFIMNKMDYSEFGRFSDFVMEQEHCNSNTFRELYRVLPLSQKQLFENGYEDEEKIFIGDKWGGKYLRAPEIYYIILEYAYKNNLINKLSNYFEGERYLNTGGADGFFVITALEDIGDKLHKIKNVKIIKKNSNSFEGIIESKYLKPIIKNYTKTNKSIEISGYDAHCLVIQDEPSDNLLNYINWAVDQGYNNRSAVKLQTPWYKPTNQMIRSATILVPRSFNDTFVIHFNPLKYLSLRFYRLHNKTDIDDTILITYLNSTMINLFQEVLGNKSLGLGALDFFMADFLSMEVPVILSNKFNEILKSLKNRNINDVFIELGFDRTKPIREQEPNPLPDRKELDDIIFDELGLTQEERKEVYWSVAELVKQRIDRAGSR